MSSQPIDPIDGAVQNLRYREVLASGHETLYHISPEFHAAVDLLARNLPRFMTLLAEDAEQMERIRAAQYEEIERTYGR